MTLCKRIYNGIGSRRWVSAVCVAGLFLLLSVMCHSIFLLWGDTIFVYNISDGMAQMMPATSFLERQLGQGETWSWAYGLGGDVFTEFSYYYSVSPFFYLSYFVKSLFGASGGSIAVTQHWKLIMSILRQTLCMLSMYALQRYEGRGRAFACLPAVLYGCSLWYCDFALRFDYMPDCMMYLPLAVMGYACMRRTGRRLPLALALALLMLNNLLTGFMCCLFMGVLFMVLTPAEGGFAGWLRGIGRLVPPVALAVLLGSVGLVPSVCAYLAIDRAQSGNLLTLLPSWDYLLGACKELFGTLGLVAVPPFALLLLSLRRGSLADECRRKTLLAAIWLAALFVPLASVIMSGFSYTSERWYFVACFALAYPLGEWVESLLRQDSRKKPDKSTLLCMAAAAAAVCLLWAAVSLSAMRQRQANGMALNLQALRLAAGVLGVLLLAALRLNAFGWAQGGRLARFMLRRWLRPAFAWLLVLSLGLTMCCGAVNFYIAKGAMHHFTAQQLADLGVGEASAAEVYDRLRPGKGEFYRVTDSEVEYAYRRYDNIALMTGAYSTAVYNSLIDGGLHSYIKRELQVFPRFVTPSYYRGFNDRLFLETAWGVRYKLGSGSPYGSYEVVSDSDVPMLHSTATVGPDMWYAAVTDEGEYAQMTLAQRDAALLQTVVGSALEGSYSAAELDNVTEQVDISLDQAGLEGCALEQCGGGEAPYETSDSDRLTSGASLQTEYALTTEEGGSLTIPLPERADTEGEYLLSFRCVENSRSRFELTVNGMTTTRFESGYAWEYDMDAFTVRLPGDAQNVTIELTAGEYTISGLLLEYNSYELLEQWVEQRERFSLEQLEVEGGSISGNISNTEAGVLVLSVPYKKGWRCTVDGAKHPLVQVNGMFTAIELEPGEHRVELEYTPLGLLLGGGITAVTVLAVAVYYFIRYIIRRKEMKAI